MNRKQIAYQVGRLMFMEEAVLPFVGLTAYSLTDCVDYLFRTLENSDNSDPIGIAYAAFGTLIGAAVVGAGLKLGAKALSYHKAAHSLRKLIKKDNGLCSLIYPFEVVDSVVMDDREGLEGLLEKTAKRHRREWGTFLHAHADKGRAVIHDIESFEKLKKEGIVDYGGIAYFRPKITIEKAVSRFNGMHHYHPGFGRWFGASNFTVSRTDRLPALDWINLLSFNIHGRPEIIAYNLLNTYIPEDKSKRILVKAGSRQIMKYLAS